MSTNIAVSMDELERESAELLPARETLCAWKCGGHGGNTTITSVSQNNTATAIGGGFLSPAIAVNALNFNDSLNGISIL